jgi:Fic family protein
MQIMHDKDLSESQGYYEVLEYIFTEYEHITISEATIIDLHIRLLKYDKPNQELRGKYKLLDNKVETKNMSGKVLRVLVVGTPPSQTPQAIRDLIFWYDDAVRTRSHHPLLLISAFLVEFLKIHPFIDGNGRLSRILTNLLLLKAGYGFINDFPLEQYIEKDKETYYLSLSKSQKTFGLEDETILSWTEYFLKMLDAQAIQAVLVSESNKLHPELLGIE